MSVARHIERQLDKFCEIHGHARSLSHRYTGVGDKFEGLRELEGKTVCKEKDCSDACCPKGTCDTAPECDADSATGEKNFDGEEDNGPAAMASK